MSDMLFDELTEIEFIDKNFVFTGLSEQQEREATKLVLRMRGMIRSSVVLQTDYLVVDTGRGTSTTKYARALELRQKGYALKMITWDAFLALAHQAMQHTPLLDFIVTDGVLEHYYGCQSHVIVPDGVISIADGVFAGRTDFFSGIAEDHYMESIELPQSLEKIGEWTFYNCNKLEEIVIPANVKEIGKWAFCGCRNLKHVEVLGEKTPVRQECFDALIFEEVLKTLIPGQVTAAIKGKALELFIKKYDSGIEMTEKYKTAWIKYIKSQRKKLVEQAVQDPALLQLLIAEKLLDKETSMLALEKSNQLGNAAATGALLEHSNQQFALESHALKTEKSLKSMTSDTVLKKLWATKKLDDGTLLLTAYKGEEATVAVPASIGGHAVSVLDSDLFNCSKKGCSRSRGEYLKSNLRKVIISEGITSISVACFANCEALVEVDLPASLLTIQRRAFDMCGSLASVRIPAGVELIDAGAYSWCNHLTDVYVTGKNTQINQFAFSNTPNVTIHAPKGSMAQKFAKKYKIPFVAE